MRTSILLSAFPCLLIACAASNDPVTLTGYADQADAIEDGLRDKGQYFVTPGKAIPTSGSASYSGVIGFDARRSGLVTESYAGAMTIRADFDAFPGNMISGGAGDFVDSADRTLDGRLDVTFGNIERLADPVFADQVLIDLDGVLIDDDGVALSVDAEADGVFLGPAANAIDGIVGGTMTSTYGIETLQGDYILGQ